MFTGIILDVGRVRSIESLKGDMCIEVETSCLNLESINPGDSIAVNGVCLTVIKKGGKTLSFDVSSETLSKTTFSRLAEGDSINLETALTPTTPLGGHWVSGHIDGEGEVIRRISEARSERFTFKIPPTLARYIAVKGSICVDGVSLTINEAGADTFDVTIVPHTLEKTIFNGYQPGRRVNLEVDIIARYLERLLDVRTNLK